MDIEHPTSRAIATTNRNRNMVLAIEQRVRDREDEGWHDGLARFGIAMLVGIEPTVFLLADDFAYEMMPDIALNENPKLDQGY